MKAIGLLHFAIVCKNLQKIANQYQTTLILTSKLSQQLGIVVSIVTCHPGGPSSVPAPVKISSFFKKD